MKGSDAAYESFIEALKASHQPHIARLFDRDPAVMTSSQGMPIGKSMFTYILYILLICVHYFILLKYM